MTDHIATEIKARDLQLAGTEMMIRTVLWLSMIRVMAQRTMCR